ncbi:MAG: xanthine dehydrogenase family protein molybdopterin-binding subunit [Inquilinus sp.]|nr:xanthine dehydrogenase family protein molybdopterin-binding subunit [Inquilinus sp.]
MRTVADRTAIGRRDFLIKTGWLAAGMTVLTSCSAARAVWPALPSTDDPEIVDGLAWVQALPGGRVRFYCPRMEMGQGASLGLSQVVAEELNIGQPEIDCVLPDTDQTPRFKMTVGSESIANFFLPVSHGAALLREALRKVAAETAGLSPDLIRDGRGGFVSPDGTELSYGMLVPSEPIILLAEDRSAAAEPPPRYASEHRGRFQAIGQSWQHPELEAIVTGRTIYSRDVSLPDMSYGQVLRPPAFGARLQSVDAGGAEAMPGVAAVVVDRADGLIGVVADDPFVLPAAVAAIDARWAMPDGLNQDRIDASLDIEKHRAEDDFEHTLTSAGDIGAGRRSAQFQVRARYDTPFAAHAAMEPRAGVAWVKDDEVEVWCGSQDPFFVQRRVAKAVGRAVDDVVVRTHRMGGAFGGRLPCQASEEAAVLSAAVGRPVRVQWDREAEFQNNYFQPGFSHHIDAGVTHEGLISHWAHDFVSSPIITGPVPDKIAWLLDAVMADEGTARGAMSQYRVADRRVRYSDIRTGVPTGAWRGLGAAPNTFAVESMMDELAIAAGIDPLQFRLQNLPPTSDRLAAVLRRVAEICQWGRSTPADTGRGIACAVYKNQTAVAVVAEVQVDHAARALRVVRTWCAQDCGMVVNPDQVESQIMGNGGWGCSMALKERITVEAGAVEQRNFHSYEILRHRDAPETMVSLVVPPDAAPVAVGESALGPVAPAIANAVFAATGRRIRRLPMSYGGVFSDAEG